MAWALYVWLESINRALAMLGSVLQLVYAAAWLAAIPNLDLIYRFDSRSRLCAAYLCSRTSVADCRTSRSLPLWMGPFVSPLRPTSGGDRLADRSLVLPSTMDWLAPLRCHLGMGRGQRCPLLCTGTTSLLPQGDLRCGTDLYSLAARVAWRITEPHFLTKEGPMTQRAESKLAGYAYLAYIVFAMSAAILSRKTTAGADTSQMLSTLRSTIDLA